MAVLGDSSLWADTFPEALIPEVLNLFLDTWGGFEKPAPDELEVPITHRLRVALIKSKLLRRMPVRIDREAVEDDLQTGEELGRIDLRFTAGGSVREDVYFALECKRLNALVQGKLVPLAGRYVGEGMVRFVRSQYSATQRHGGMVAYILDGDLPSAVQRIDRNLRSKYADLRMEGSSRLEASSLLSHVPEVRETRHRLERGTFFLHHILLAC